MVKACANGQEKLIHFGASGYGHNYSAAARKSFKARHKCGTSKNKKNPDRCLPLKKAKSMSKSDRAATARKKKSEGAKGKQVVANTQKAKVTKKFTER